jgi:peptidoglycan/xylan/chitin deacetylase (PgdA/CDA1 family)
MTIPAGYSKVRMTEFDAIVDVGGNVVGMVDADGSELWFAESARDASGAAAGLAGRNGSVIQIGPTRMAPVAPNSSRITKAGYNIFAFTDHTAFTASGAEAAAYTLSTVSGFNGIAAGDTPEGVAQGSKTGSTAMVKLVCNGSQAGAANYFITSASNLNLTTGDEKFGMWVYFSTDITTNSSWIQPAINIDVSTANTFNGDAADYTFSFNGNQIRQGWNFLVFKCDATTHPYGVTKSGIGSNLFATNGLKKFRIYVTVPNGKTLTVYFDTLWSNFNAVPAVALGFDTNGDSALLNYTLPALQAYGLRGYVACIGAGGVNDNTNNRATDYNSYINNSAQLTALSACYAAGWDIANHTLNHTNTSNGGSVRTQLLTDGQLQYQVQGQTVWQLAHGYDRGKEFYCAPQGAWDSTTIYRLQQWGYKIARMGQQHMNNTRTVFGYDQLMNMGWYQIDAPHALSANYDSWIIHLQTLFDYGADVIIAGHHTIADVGTVTGSSTTGNSLQVYSTSLRMLCAWLKAKHDAGTIRMVTLSEMYYEGKTPDA